MHGGPSWLWSVPLAVMILSPGQPANTKQRPPQALTEDFIRESRVGQAVRAYLTCMDLECGARLEDLAGFGSEAVDCMILLLRFGPPPSMAELGEAPSRTRMARALGELGDARSVAVLVDMLSDRDAVSRAEAASALGALKDAHGVPALIRALRDPDSLVREMAAKALGRLGRVEALPHLRSALDVESASHVRKAIEEAIEALR